MIQGAYRLTQIELDFPQSTKNHSCRSDSAGTQRCKPEMDQGKSELL